jgi:preprotein translocase subunit YajC
MWQNIIIAQAAPEGSIFVQLLPFLLIFGVFWFLVIRPQQKRQKEHQALLGSLKKDDEVITSGGILGTIEKVDGQILTLRISRDTKIKIVRTQVEGLQGALLPGASDETSKKLESESASGGNSSGNNGKNKSKKSESVAPNDGSDESGDESADDDSKNW